MRENGADQISNLSIVDYVGRTQTRGFENIRGNAVVCCDHRWLLIGSRSFIYPLLIAARREQSRWPDSFSLDMTAVETIRLIGPMLHIERALHLPPLPIRDSMSLNMATKAPKPTNL